MKITLILILSFAVSAFADPNALPDIGSASTQIVSEKREREMGEEGMRQIKQKVKIYKDYDIQSYMDQLGQHLSSSVTDYNGEFTFFVVEARSINAFAMPGGYIGFNAGLILATRSEGELASVMAHEMAHVTQHHMARLYQDVDQLSGLSIAALAAAILVGSQDAEAGMAILSAGQAGLVQHQIDMTREKEAEADSVGIKILAASGFDPRSMPAFFEQLSKASRFYGEYPEFLLTHPVTDKRIADTGARAERYPIVQTKDSLIFQLARTKLRVLLSKDLNSLKESFSQAAKSETAARYGLALVLKKQGQHQQALKWLNRLHTNDPDQISYILALAATLKELKQDKKALKILQQGLLNSPTNRYIFASMLDLYIQNNKFKEAQTQLANFEKNQTLDADLFELKSRLKKRLGYPIESHIAMAEHYLRIGELHAAIDQLERAQKIKTNNFILASRVDARLNEFKEMTDEEDDSKKSKSQTKNQKN